MKVIMGLEVHTRMETKSKFFCSCSTDIDGAEPNSHTCPVCLGFPGSKPAANKKVLDFGTMVARALNCKINQEMFFSRKSYFYPDMPKNFQISQYEIPIASKGWLQLSNKKIRITRVHLEEDPAKLQHVGGDITSAQYVLVDYNRAGMPLIEIVTEPDFETTKEVREFLAKLSSILEHLEVYDSAKEASLRVDANISIEGSERVEIKNITGFANVEKALNYEIIRHQNLLRMGQKIVRETRHFDAQTKSTASLRKKEFEDDYGYIFEPDLTKIVISNQWINQIKMPELPDQRAARFMQQYKLREREANIIVYVDKALADFFEACSKLYKGYEQLSFWTVGDLLKNLNANDIAIRQSKITPENFVELLKLIDSGKITGKLAKEIIKDFVKTGQHPAEIIKRKKIVVIGKTADIEKIVREVVAANKKAYDEFKSGKREVLGFLIGEVMKRTRAAADPKVVKKIIEKM